MAQQQQQTPSPLPADFMPAPSPRTQKMRSAEYVSLLPAKDAPDSETSTLVVHLQRATGLPKLLQLNRSMLSPYVTMWLLDKASGVQLGQRTTWQHRPDTRDPVWNTAMPLHVPNLCLLYTSPSPRD